MSETTTRTEELRRLAEKATGTEWAVSGEIQGDAPAVVLHAGDLDALLDVVEAARALLGLPRDSDDMVVPFATLRRALDRLDS